MKQSISALSALLFALCVSTCFAEESTDSPKKASAEKVEVSSEAKPVGEAYPVSGSASLGYTINHAKFVESNGDFGYQRLSASGSVSYQVIDKLSVSSGISVGKALDVAYDSSGGSSRNTLAPWEVNDISVSASYSGFYKIPVADISMSSSLGLTFPLSKVSRAGGLIMAVSPNLSLSWGAAGFSASLSGGYSHYVNKSATRPIDCDAAPHNCAVSGNDSGTPNSLHSINGALSLGYQIIEGLRVSSSYAVSNGWSAVQFDDDEFTSEFAQTGSQSGTGRQSFSLGLSYSVFKKTSLSFRYRNSGSLWVYEGSAEASSDSAKYNQPFFDTANDNFHSATSYTLGLSQRF